MRILVVALAASLAGSVPVQPQTPQSQATAPLSHSAAPGKPAPTIKRVTRPPASIAAPEKARTSTAERVAATVSKPPLKDLPAFTVSDRNGAAVAASAVPHATAHWFLLYRQQNCLPCDRLMNILAASTNSSLTGGAPFVIVVAGKSQQSLETVRGSFSGLGNATWLVDKDNQAFTALKPRGTPMLYALEGNRIVFTVPGTLAKPELVEQMAASWMATPPTGTRSTTSIAAVPSAAAPSGMVAKSTTTPPAK